MSAAFVPPPAPKKPVSSVSRTQNMTVKPKVARVLEFPAPHSVLPIPVSERSTLPGLRVTSRGVALAEAVGQPIPASLVAVVQDKNNKKKNTNDQEALLAKWMTTNFDVFFLEPDEGKAPELVELAWPMDLPSAWTMQGVASTRLPGLTEERSRHFWLALRSMVEIREHVERIYGMRNNMLEAGNRVALLVASIYNTVSDPQSDESWTSLIARLRLCVTDVTTARQDLIKHKKKFQALADLARAIQAESATLALVAARF